MGLIQQKLVTEVKQVDFKKLVFCTFIPGTEIEKELVDKLIADSASYIEANEDITIVDALDPAYSSYCSLHIEFSEFSGVVEMLLQNKIYKIISVEYDAI